MPGSRTFTESRTCSSGWPGAVVAKARRATAPSLTSSTSESAVPTVELIYDGSCPNVAAARTQLLRAFARAGLTPSWSELRIGDPAKPRHARGYGSPTILVDGLDVSPEYAPGVEASCRLYGTAETGPSRVPAVSEIAAALAHAISIRRSPDRVTGWRSSLAVLPGVGAALLPKMACPACWPAYAGLLSSAGLGFLGETRWLLPLTAAFLCVAVGALAFRARARRGYGPCCIGLVASAVVLLGKFALESDAAMYAGIGLLVAASLWNTWPRSAAECPACAIPGR